MISLRYLRFVALSFLASGISAVLLFPKHPDANSGVVALSSVFAILFMSLIVIRLPVFNNFYRNKKDTWIIDNRHSSFADYKAAPAIAGIVTGGAIGLILLSTGVSNIFVPAFCGGVGAGVMSFYHAP
ncbi:MAG: hypothetical protein M8364_15520 [Methylobacter sp.]|uniref:hypothetical protein n=1 Tax=Methylobacter sp. TaxID=2051955 RepID=UPI00258F2FD4|nr:hypothetical protein [Methylobacter sp.]MCL7422300.1 hypothetical protein [Methylobacter sp.]